MIGVECEKENSGSSWFIGSIKPNSFETCSNVTGNSNRLVNNVSDYDRLYCFV